MLLDDKNLKNLYFLSESLITGEFTPENQQRLKQEEEKEQIKLDPWKVSDELQCSVLLRSYLTLKMAF